MEKSPHADVFTVMKPKCGVHARRGNFCNHPATLYNKGCDYYTLKEAANCPLQVPIIVCDICWHPNYRSDTRCRFCGTPIE